MSKQGIITGVIISACILAIIILVIRLTKASKEESEAPTTTQEETYPETFTEEADTTFFEEDTLQEETLDTMTKTTPKAAVAETPETSADEQPALNTSSLGKYMVLAGTFTKRANADQLANRLKSLGYTNTRVEIFDRGKYAVVLVDRFDNLDAAHDLQQRLKADGVNSFVKLKSDANR